MICSGFILGFDCSETEIILSTFSVRKLKLPLCNVDCVCVCVLGALSLSLVNDVNINENARMQSKGKSGASQLITLSGRV